MRRAADEPELDTGEGEREWPAGKEKQERVSHEAPNRGMGGKFRVSALQRVVAVDWSGDKGPGQRKKIWAGVWTRGAAGKVAGGRVRLESGRTREELIGWLIGMARETPAMVVSIDCCFSYPAWFLREHGCGTVFEFWRHVAAGQGERWLGSGPGLPSHDERFWGRPQSGRRSFAARGIRRMMRRTDMENKVEFGGWGDAARAALMKGIQPKSPFQIGGQRVGGDRVAAGDGVAAAALGAWVSGLAV